MTNILAQKKLFLGYLLQGDERMLDAAMDKIKPEYLVEPFFCKMVALIFGLHTSKIKVNLITVLTSYFAVDTNNSARFESACHYFRLAKTVSVDEVKKTLATFLAECSSMTASGSEYDALLSSIFDGYIRDMTQHYYDEYLAKIGNPLAISDFTQQLQVISNLIDGESWRASIVDLNLLRNQDIPGPLIQRGEEGLIYRNDVHMISGAPGAMKSKFAMCIAMAAMNDGLEAERTLGMFSTSQGLRVAYVDTELGADTIKRRIPMWEASCGQRVYDQSRLAYIPLRHLPKAERLRQIYSIIKDGGYDIVIIDGLRDIAVDFNDAREASSLADTFKRLADTTNTAIIVTSHTAKGTDFSRGHLGSQFTDEVGLEIILRRQTCEKQMIDVIIAKSRHSLPQKFAFQQDKNLLYVSEPSQDHTLLSRSQQSALALFHKTLTPGQKYRYADLIKKLTINGIPEATAKKYIKEAKGVTLQFDNKRYSLPGTNSLDDVLPEGMDMK